ASCFQQKRLLTTVSHLLGDCFSQIPFLSIFQLACRPYSKKSKCIWAAGTVTPQGSAYRGSFIHLSNLTKTLFEVY
ncbi:MAG: hypothetical protein AAFY16_07190, partial [Cyanobacteria bacterium J06642_3]